MHSQKGLFLILKVLFLIKLLKHLKGFIYYTKYKSSRVIKSFGHYHCFTDAQHSFCQRL